MLLGTLLSRGHRTCRRIFFGEYPMQIEPTPRELYENERGLSGCLLTITAIPTTLLTLASIIDWCRSQQISEGVPVIGTMTAIGLLTIGLIRMKWAEIDERYGDAALPRVRRLPTGTARD